jgi:hypothetical protein
MKLSGHLKKIYKKVLKGEYKSVEFSELIKSKDFIYILVVQALIALSVLKARRDEHEKKQSGKRYGKDAAITRKMCAVFSRPRLFSQNSRRLLMPENV